MENQKEKINLIVDTCIQCNSIIIRFEDQIPVCEVCRFREEQMEALGCPEYFVRDIHEANCKN